MASRTLFVAHDREESLRLADIGLRRVVDHFVDVGFLAPGRSLPELIAAFDVHVGTPEDVIKSLRADSTLDRVTDLVFQVHSVDPPHAHILRSVELIAVSAIGTIETDQRFSGREDFWIIVAARREDETEIRSGRAAGGRRDRGHSARDPSTFFN